MIHILKPRLGTRLNTKHPLSKGLIGCLLMNEKTGDKIFNSGIENFYGTNIGADWTPEGLYFGGADRVSVPKVLINDHAAFTISATFNGTADNIIYGEGYDGDSEWAIFLGIEADPPYSARFLIKENNVWKASTVGTSQVNVGWHTVSVVQKNKSSRTIFIDGVPEATNTDVVGDMSILNTANVGVLERTTFVSYFTGGINQLYIHNRALADAEVKLYKADPYKIFEPGITLVQLSTLLEGVTLTVEDLAGIGLLDNTILTQKHTLTVQELLSSGALDNTTLTQKHLLVLQELLSAGVLDSVAIIQKNILSVQELSGAGILDSIALTQKHILAVQDLLSSGAIDNVELSTAILLVVAEMLSSGTLDTADPI
ncbi:MAG: LamG domain-containing protein, partial [Nanoarchaeota archaeon]|nr:LamG domain-containing protein [Nanoarchaeota archaeon]